ncbi:PQ loop repeat-domain-containing protein [Thamnocephalis sphaerospora]|uniref:PQ loop repeat-domain-containing protein n=1 Tax=Thamnocephalis sphaerospora TaxID=78915 RepID=A0A4V1IX51_9FUNG|nr:PQ loop repeat-domain-containing protein [Thamnocephalis sphaerospora]|eukprot:RKP09839.1 PQ loop repeat-domain-containing protein [Thamnocephalis sphaerospora]
MVIAPAAAYIDQYTVMRRTGSARGFSSAICGVLLVANILRVFFWIGRRFDDALLCQSVVMMGTQLVLLHLCLRCRAFDEPNGAWMRERSLWRWPLFEDYVSFLTKLSVGLALLQLFLGQQEWYVETIGFLSVGIEAALPVPQAISNYQRKSVEGFSPVVLLSWFGGDLFKTIYYYATGAPLQFLICGIFQLAVDCFILGQTLAYGTGFQMSKSASSGRGASRLLTGHATVSKKNDNEHV